MKGTIVILVNNEEFTVIFEAYFTGTYLKLDVFDVADSEGMYVNDPRVRNVLR